MSRKDDGCPTCGCSCSGQYQNLVAAQGSILETRIGQGDVDLSGRDLQGRISSPYDASNMYQEKHIKHAGPLNLNIESFLSTQHAPTSHLELGKMRSRNGVSNTQSLATALVNEEEEEFLSMKSLMIVSDSTKAAFPPPPHNKVDPICHNPLPVQNILELGKLSRLSRPVTSAKAESVVSTLGNKVGPDIPKPNIPSWMGGPCSSAELDVSSSSSDTDSDNQEMLSVKPASHKRLMNNSEKSVDLCNTPQWLDNIGEMRDENIVSDAEFELSGELAGYGRKCFLPNMITKTVVLKLGDSMEEKEGVGIEFWDVDDLSKLYPTTLAVLLCGMLNSGSGVVWAGVAKDGRVRGCEMGRMQRDKIRQMLDKVCSNNISPRVGPRIVDIDFVKVEGDKDLWLVKYTVRLNMEVLYRVKNIDTTRFNQGVYVRNNTGPDFTEFVSEEVLKIIQN